MDGGAMWEHSMTPAKYLPTLPYMADAALTKIPVPSSPGDLRRLWTICCPHVQPHVCGETLRIRHHRKGIINVSTAIMSGIVPFGALQPSPGMWLCHFDDLATVPPTLREVPKIENICARRS